MRTSFRLGILAAVLLAPSIAVADESGWYVGLELGSAKATALPGDLGFFPAAGVPSGSKATITNSSSLNSTSGNLEGGYWFNSNVGLQAGLLDLGTYSGGISFKDSVPDVCINTVCGSASNDNRQVKASGVMLAVTGRVSLSEDFDLLGRIGVFLSHTTFDETLTSDARTVDEAHLTKDNVASLFGAGLGWKFTSHWEAQWRWDLYSHLGGGDFSTFNVRVYSLGVEYQF